MPRKHIPAMIAAALTMTALPTFASSDAAWEEFRQDVGDRCAELVEAPEDADVAVEVNPFGSESHGAAIVTVTLADGGADRMICIYDKQDGSAELTAPFEPAP